MKKVSWTLALVTWMIIIFLFSNQTGNESQSVSDSVTGKIIDIYAQVANKDFNDSEKEKLITNTSFSIRKLAHFTLYFILGVMMYYTLNSYGIKNKVIWSILFCFLYACSDELHQLFSLDRAGRVLDVFIDSMGSVSAILSIIAVRNIKQKISRS